MSIYRHKFIAMYAGLLMCGWAGAGEERTLSLGNCVSRVAEARPLAIKICQARLARSIMNSGASACVGGRRVVQGRIHCNRRDSAANASGAVSEFEPYHTRLNGPVSIGSIETFYAGRRAGGANRRFQVTGQADGSIKIAESGVPSGNEESCTFATGSYQCVVNTGFVGSGAYQTRHIREYVLRLDGLMVEEETQKRFCYLRCLGRPCRRSCEYRSRLETPTVTQQRLYSWD